MKYISQDNILIIPEGSTSIIQYKSNSENHLEKLKEFPQNKEDLISIGKIFHTQSEGEAHQFVTFLSDDLETIKVVDIENLAENRLVIPAEDHLYSCIESFGRLILIKISKDKKASVFVDQVFIPPQDKISEVINSVASDGNLGLALEMAGRISDPSVGNNLRLRNEWEGSNRTLQDIKMLLSKIQDRDYILTQCVSNSSPNKNIRKEQAVEYIGVQRELIKIALGILADSKYVNFHSEEIIKKILEKEQNLQKYEVILEAFQDDSQMEIIDWESYANFSFIDMINYVNSICLSEGTGVENVLLELKQLNLQEFYRHFYDILRVLDTDLMNDHFTSLILPQGNDTLEESQRLKRGDLDLAFDPLPYQIVAKRIFLEEFRPSKAYNLLLLGIQRGIKCLDYDVVSAFEIAEILELNKQEKVLSNIKDIRKIIDFDNSYHRYKYLIQNDYFLESYFQ